MVFFCASPPSLLFLTAVPVTSIWQPASSRQFLGSIIHDQKRPQLARRQLRSASRPALLRCPASATGPLLSFTSRHPLFIGEVQRVFLPLQVGKSLVYILAIRTAT
ncbi:hypothetical protein NL676_034096 [Syzygium grande]|nr:hypothetical protein NL676_034096 [Syzygium grande]